jgi:hypothetical protein
LITESEQYLRSWIDEFLSKPDALLNGLPPCPYARKAKIKFVETDNYIFDITQCLENWSAEYDVVGFVCGDVEPASFVLDVRCLNDYWLSRGFVCLEDHKDIPEVFHHLNFNNGRYNLILVQRTEKLNAASKQLTDAGYYKNWSKNLYNDVVAWRLGGA